MQSDRTYWNTPYISMAAYLSLHMPIVDAFYEAETFVWVFERNQQLADHVARFNMDEARVNPRAYTNRVKELRNELRQATSDLRAYVVA